MSVPGPSPPPAVGGALFPPVPLWYPPMSMKWIGTGFLVFAGAAAHKMPSNIRGFFASPLGFFATALVALFVFQRGFEPAAFAILFMLLMMWSATQTRVAEGMTVGNFLTSTTEGFLCPSSVPMTVDYNPDPKQRWFVERVLGEGGVGVQEKDVATYPVQGASTQAGTSAGNT